MHDYHWQHKPSKNNYSYTPGSTSTINQSGGNSYQVNVNVDGGKYDPQSLAYLVMGEIKSNNEARYIHGVKGKGMFTFYGGHDPEDYTHRVGDPKTELDLHPTSPGYRLILNNVLFPAARKKKQKT